MLTIYHCLKLGEKSFKQHSPVLGGPPRTSWKRYAFCFLALRRAACCFWCGPLLGEGVRNTLTVSAQQQRAGQQRHSPTWLRQQHQQQQQQGRRFKTRSLARCSAAEGLRETTGLPLLLAGEIAAGGVASLLSQLESKAAAALRARLPLPASQLRLISY